MNGSVWNGELGWQSEMRYCLIHLLSITILMGCSKQYEPIPPKFVTSAEVNFKGINENQIVTKILYSVPNNYNLRESFPLVVALHGSGSNSAAFHNLWKSTTDPLGFVLLTPQGDSMTEEGFGWRWGNNADRSVLISIDIVRKLVNIDPRRIYIAGFSSGGRLAYVLGLKYSNLFRGIKYIPSVAALNIHWIIQSIKC